MATNMYKSNDSVCNLSKTQGKNIRLLSYNSRGFGLVTQQFCRNLLNMDNNVIPIICNQENFILKGNDYISRKALPEFHVIFKPATKEHLEGRPKNGMFIALPVNLRNKVKDISPNSSRVQAMVLDTDSEKLMIINTYFPPDPKTVIYGLESDMEDVLAVIENMMDSYQCNNVLIVGDLNTDFIRNNGRVKRFDMFLSSNTLESSWKKFDVDYTHEFENNGLTYTSTIDHILWNECFRKNVKNSGVLHLPENTTDHSPIFCNIRNICESSTSSVEKGNAERFNIRSLKSSDWDQYVDILDQKLRYAQIPACANCKSVHCKDTNHVTDIDDYATNILEILDTSIKSVTMKSSKSNARPKVVPGWSEAVKPFHGDAMFWHAVWKSSGKPLNNSIHHTIKRTRNLYHYAIRKCKKSVEQIKKNKLLDACINGKGNIFDEFRKIRHVKRDLPQTIDGSNNIPDEFANVYKKLYNSTQEQVETLKILGNVNTSIDILSLKDVDLVTSDIIRKAVEQVKANKNDPVFTFNSDCIKRAPATLLQHLTNIIQIFLIHGYVSKILLVATIVPLIKDKLGDTESSDNYRSISLSSIILKVFDWVVILPFGKSLNLDSLQFSYQKHCGTNICTWLVVESISYFLRNGSEVFATFMDMKKAFDMVKHSLLFRKLIERNLPPIFTRLLIVMYISQTAKVKWENGLSDSFSITNGVKQGVVLSAILFCVYIHDLISQLRRNRTGCWVNGDYVGVIHLMGYKR